MNLTLTIADASANRVIDAIAATHDYQSMINGVPNPETKSQFAKRMLIQEIKIWVRDAELRVSRQTITDSAEAIDIT